MSEYRSPCKDLCIQSCANRPFKWPGIKCSCPSPKPQGCLKCYNLVQNPSFETDLSSWEIDNVTIHNSSPFEGTQVASLGPGIASMYQDVPLAKLVLCPLFLSFNAFAGSDNESNGNLVVEVSWLDADRNIIANGLRIFIPNDRINFNAKITFFDITDRPPADAARARLQFSKGAGASPDFIVIDQVILAPVSSINLIQNPSFEAGLTHWAATPDTSFVPFYFLPIEGAADAFAVTTGILSQDVPIHSVPDRSTFLLSFAAVATGPVTLTVRVEWRNAAGNPIGSGLNLFIPSAVLNTQGNYLTYLDITDSAPAGTAIAHITFAAGINEAGSSLFLDQVIFARAGSENLVINPSFEDSLNGWTPVNVTLFSSDSVYEGAADARAPEGGGSLLQDVPIAKAAGHCFLFNCGLGFRRVGSQADFGIMLIKVFWLDNSGNEIGLGLSLIGTSSALIQGDLTWLVYTGITEPAPAGTVAARIQFTKTSSSNGVIEIDKVVLGRLI